MITRTQLLPKPAPAYIPELSRWDAPAEPRPVDALDDGPEPMRAASERLGAGVAGTGLALPAPAASPFLRAGAVAGGKAADPVARTEKLATELHTYLERNASKVSGAYLRLSELQPIHDAVARGELRLKPRAQHELTAQTAAFHGILRDYQRKTGALADALLQHVQRPEVAAALARAPESRAAPLAAQIAKDLARTSRAEEVRTALTSELVGATAGEPAVNPFLRRAVAGEGTLGNALDVASRIAVLGTLVGPGLGPRESAAVREALGAFMSPSSNTLQRGVDAIGIAGNVSDDAGALSAALDLVDYFTSAPEERKELVRKLEAGQSATELLAWGLGKADSAGALSTTGKLGTVGTLSRWAGSAGAALGVVVSSLHMREASRRGEIDQVVNNWVKASGYGLMAYGLGAEATGLGVPFGVVMQTVGTAAVLGAEVYDFFFAPSDIERYAARHGLEH